MARNMTLVNMVEERFRQSQRATQAWREMWLRCYELYRGYREALPEHEADRSNLHIPMVFAHIETILPRVVASTLGRRPWVTIQPREPGDERAAKMNEELFEYQADRQDLFAKLVGFYKEALFYGTAVGKNTWRHEVKKRRVRERQDFVISTPFGPMNVTQLLGLDPVYVEVEKEIVMWDDPWFEHVDLFDFYPDPDGRNIADMKWAIHRTFASLEDLRRAGIYKNLDRVQEGSGYDEERGSDTRLAAISRASTPDSSERSKSIELLEHWEDDRVIVVANRSVVIRDEANPFWHGGKPFIAMVDTPLPHEFYGVGTIEPIRFLQEEKNAIRNQRRDNVTLALQRMFIAARNANIDPNDLIWRPGGVIWVDALDDVNKLIQPIQVPEVTRSSYEEEALLGRDAEDATGASEFARGNTPGRSATATEIQQLAMATSSRVDLKVRLMAHQGLVGIARHWVALNQQFITEKRFIRITGRSGWTEVRPEYIAGEFDYIPGAANVESFANRHEKRRDLLEALQVSANPVDAAIVNRVELWKELIQLYDFGDPERFIREAALAPAGGLTPTSAGAAELLAAAAGAPGGGVQPSGAA